MKIITVPAAAAVFVASVATASATFPPGNGGKIPADAVGFDEPILFVDPNPLAALAGLIDEDEIDNVVGPPGDSGPFGAGVRSISPLCERRC